MTDPQTTIVTPNALGVEHLQTVKVPTRVTLYYPICDYDTDADVQGSFGKDLCD